MSFPNSCLGTFVLYTLFVPSRVRFGQRAEGIAVYCQLGSRQKRVSKGSLGDGNDNTVFYFFSFASFMEATAIISAVCVPETAT